MMQRRSFLALGGVSILALGATGVRAQTAPNHARASSPGGVLTVEAFTDNDGRPMYSVLRQGRVVVAPTFDGGGDTDHLRQAEPPPRDPVKPPVLD